MKRTAITYATAVLLAAALAGCGNGAGPAAGGLSPVEMAAGGDPDIDPASGAMVIPRGRGIDHEGLTTTLGTVTCGIQTIVNGRDNPAQDTYDTYEVDAAEYLPLQAESGKEFCRAFATYRNNSSGPNEYFSNLGNLVASDGKEYAADQASEHAADIQNQARNTGSINPGDERLHEEIWQVPAGTQAAFVTFPDPGVFGGDVTYRFAVR